MLFDNFETEINRYAFAWVSHRNDSKLMMNRFEVYRERARKFYGAGSSSKFEDRPASAQVDFGVSLRE